MTFLITGIYNQCGCALRWVHGHQFPRLSQVEFSPLVKLTQFTSPCCNRLRWAVSEGGRPFRDRVSVPTQHIKFMKGKRQEVLANFAASTSFGVAFGAMLYALKGLLTKSIFTGLLYGSATHITVMVVASLLS